MLVILKPDVMTPKIGIWMGTKIGRHRAARVLCTVRLIERYRTARTGARTPHDWDAGDFGSSDGRWMGMGDRSKALILPYP